MEAPQKVFNYIKDREQLKQRLEGQDIVLVGGCFDILHYGHLCFLKKAAKAGGRLVIALESDEFIRQNKKRDPVHSQEQRAEILSHLDLVDTVIMLPLLKGNGDYYNLVGFVHPRVIACTVGDPYVAQKKDQAASVNGTLIEVNYCEGFSSSAIKQYAALSGD